MRSTFFFFVLPLVLPAKIQRPGADFANGNQVYPGEAISIRLRGQSLHRSRFEIPGLTDLERDSSRSTAAEQVYRATVPANIAERRLPIIGPDGETGKHLQVVEFSRPHRRGRVSGFVYSPLIFDQPQ